MHCHVEASSSLQDSGQLVPRSLGQVLEVSQAARLPTTWKPKLVSSLAGANAAGWERCPLEHGLVARPRARWLSGSEQSGVWQRCRRGRVEGGGSLSASRAAFPGWYFGRCDRTPESSVLPCPHPPPGGGRAIRGQRPGSHWGCGERGDHGLHQHSAVGEDGVAGRQLLTGV